MKRETGIENKWLHADLELDNTSLHYIRTGNGGKPPLVLVHGFSDDGSCWEPVARKLETHFDIVMPDMPGHGLSARKRKEDVPDMAADLAALIYGLGFRRPFVCGHSMGAMVSFELALRFPDLAGALVLEDPPWWNPLPENNFETDVHIQDEPPVVRWARSLADKTYEQLLEEYRKDNTNWPDSLIRNMVRAKKRLDQSVIGMLSLYVGRNGLRWKTDIGKISMPLLLLTADPATGAVITPEISAKIISINEHVSVKYFPETGHLIHFDRQEEFITAILGFFST